MGATLAEQLARRDADRYVGRQRELELFERLLGDDPPASVVLLHGRGGIGKSALLREVVRRASARGRAVRVVDGRHLAPAPGELERALDGVVELARPLLVFDSYERMSAATGFLRSRIIPSLREGALVVLAGRSGPDEAWFSGGWEHLSLEISLGPLSSEEARLLLAQHGVTEEKMVDRLVRWAEGFPLALTLAARAVLGPRPLDPDRIEEHRDLMSAVVRQIARDELGAGGADVAVVGAVARAVTERMLREVLPQVDARGAMRWLRGLTFADPVDDAVALHELVRRGLRAELRAQAPERYGNLRRRIVDHLYEEAARGEPRLVIDLAELIDNDAVRWGFGVDGSVECRVDLAREGDVEAAAPLYERALQNPDWFANVREFIERAPDHVIVARDPEDRLTGICIAVTAADAPEVAYDDPILSRWLAHASETMPGEDVLLWLESMDLRSHDDPTSPVVALMNTAAFLRSGLTNPRWFYLALDPELPHAVEFMDGVGAVHVPELDVTVGTQRIECRLLDHGKGGILANVRDIVYAEVGAQPDAPAPDHAASAEDVRAALRDLHSPPALSRNALARGKGTEARAQHVRELIEGAAERAFGDSPKERTLRAVLEYGYLDPEASSGRAISELKIGRTTYFRLLREAVARVAEEILGASPPGER